MVPKVHKAMIMFEFTCLRDHYVYVKRTNTSFLILYLCSDDVLFLGNDNRMVTDTRGWLSLIFDMKNMGEASLVLGLKIVRDHLKRLIVLSQKAYTNMVIE